MQGSLPIPRAAISIPHTPTQNADLARSNSIIGSIAIALPIVLVCAIVGYQKYQTTVMQRRIQRLNRLWQLDSNKKLS